MHEHDKCKHSLKYCEKCDMVYCEKCKKEWKRNLIPSYNTYTSCPIYPINSTYSKYI